ncbi:Uncharacterized ABC transporter ATP-binding protein sll0182 [Durusdinium trenchii]|uniref:Uncharacterized ABC transporter ATP-binding protein sll0182 n=1 Tax=Durusdinium trenchii TaxID=1381693 RepID=A0ABP0HCJ8_9DINO
MVRSARLLTQKKVGDSGDGREKERLLSEKEVEGGVYLVPAVTCQMLLRNVTVKAPGSELLLVEDLNISVGAGQRLLVVGPSGCGKTSVLRVASGLWEPSVGSVQRPPVGELLFVPQRPYMLLGSLREQLCYPLPQDSFDDDALRDTLKKVRLQKLVDRYPDLGVKQDWPRLLSLGEQQRLAFARLLLNAPRFAVAWTWGRLVTWGMEFSGGNHQQLQITPTNQPPCGVLSHPSKRSLFRTA